MCVLSALTKSIISRVPTRNHCIAVTFFSIRESDIPMKIM